VTATQADAERREEERAAGTVRTDKLPRLVTGVVVTAIIAASVWMLSGAPNPFAAAPPPPVPTKVAVIRVNLPDVGSDRSAGRVGVAAPNFQWLSPDGTAHTLADLRGKTVVINWWATWCGPCRAEMPALQRVARNEPNVVFLGINLQEDEDQVATFFERLELANLTPIIDPNGETARRFGIAALPDTFFVGPDGVIKHVEIGGPMSEDAIRAGIAKAR